MSGTARTIGSWSIRTKIVVGTGIVVSASWLLLVGFSFAATSLLLNISAKQMFESASRVLSAEMRHAYEPVERTTALLAVSKIVLARSEADRLRFVPVLVERLRDLPAATAIQVGDDAGGFFIVRALNEVLVGRFEAPPGTAFGADLIEGGSGRFRRWFYDDALKLIESRELPPSAFDPRSRPWYQRAVDADGVVATPPYVFFFMGKIGVTLARSTADRSTVVATDITLDSMSRALAAHRITPSAQALIGGPRGVLAWSGAGAALVTESGGALRARTLGELGHPAFSAIAAGQTAQGWLVHRAPLGIRSAQDAELIIAVPEAELLAELAGVRTRVLVISFVILALVVPLTWALANRIANPLRDLHKAIRRVGEGDFDFGLPEARTRDEVGDLNRALRAMQGSLKRHVEALAAAAAARERLRSELDIARRIQMSLVPGGGQLTGAAEGMPLFGRLVPARAVGGDLYLVMPLGEGRVFVAVGDVSDKGIPAALLMSRVVALTKMLLPKSADLASLLRDVNDELAEGNDECMFVTFFCAVVDARTGAMRYACAGHNPPLVVGGDAVRWLALESGPPLGLFAGSAYAESSVRLERGDRLVMYSDGITEAFNAAREQFSEERLQAMLETGGRGGSIEHLGNAILDGVTAFAGGAPQSDDITLLILERT